MEPGGPLPVVVESLGGGIWVEDDNVGASNNISGVLLVKVGEGIIDGSGNNAAQREESGSGEKDVLEELHDFYRGREDEEEEMERSEG